MVKITLLDQLRQVQAARARFGASATSMAVLDWVAGLPFDIGIDATADNPALELIAGASDDDLLAAREQAAREHDEVFVRIMLAEIERRKSAP